MRLYPFDRFTIHSELLPEAILNLIQNHVEPKKWFRLSNTHRYFEGEVSKTGFTIQRILDYRNTAQPYIVATVRQEDGRSLIRITMSPHPLALALMALFMALGLSMGMAIAPALILGRIEFHPLLLLPLGMVGVVYLIAQMGFWCEAKPQKAYLIKLFNQPPNS